MWTPSLLQCAIKKAAGRLKTITTSHLREADAETSIRMPHERGGYKQWNTGETGVLRLFLSLRSRHCLVCAELCRVFTVLTTPLPRSVHGVVRVLTPTHDLLLRKHDLIPQRALSTRKGVSQINEYQYILPVPKFFSLAIGNRCRGHYSFLVTGPLRPYTMGHQTIKFKRSTHRGGVHGVLVGKKCRPFH